MNRIYNRASNHTIKMTAKNKLNNISINLNCYTIRFRKKNNKENFLTFSEVFSSQSFTDIIQEFVKTIDANVFVNGSNDRILYLDRGLTVNQSIFSGILRKGNCGHETNVDELEAHKVKTVNRITANQYNSTPFYFNLTLPSPNSNYLLLIAQTYKQYGFKELFEEAFQKFFNQHHSNNILMEFGTLSIASLFEKYCKEGYIKKIRFKKHTLTTNLENLFRVTGDKEKSNFEMEISVSVKKRGVLSILNNISWENTSFIEKFPIEGYEYDEVFADISFGGRKRVLNITKPDNFSASYDVTEKATIDSLTKLPDFLMLDKEAKQIIHDEIIPNINP